MKNLRIPIKTTISLSFFITLFLIVSLLIGFNYIRSSKSALQTAETLMENQSQQIFMKIETLYEPMAYLSKQASSLPAVGVKPTLQTHPAEEYMLNAMKYYNQIQIQYIGFQDGDFYCIYSLNDQYTEAMRNNTHAPKDARYAILRQYTPVGGTTAVRLWRYLNDSGQTIGSYKEENTSYDPRTRIWFESAISSNMIQKSPPYLFDNAQQYGITFSINIDSSIPAVYGVDILLSEISDYLEEIKKYENQTILIFNQDLEIIAAPDSIYPLVSHPITLLQNSTNPLLVSIAAELNNQGIEKNMTLNLDIGNRFYLIKILEIPDQFDRKEYILTAIPRDIILGPLAQNSMLNLLYSVLLFLLSIPLILLVASYISKPIKKLALEAAIIRNQNFLEDIKIKSRILEINELAEEMAIMKRGLRHFNKYVPSRLVTHLLENKNELKIGGYNKNMSIMFTDIVNFTQISENSKPEEIMQYLSTYFDVITKIIRSYNGLVDKYIGDAVMAFWNAPYDDPDHVNNVCRAALEIQKVLNKSENEKIDKGGIGFLTRIGIDSGAVVVGNVGSSERMNYTVIGDTVNNASRLEGVNKIYNTEILISEKVAALLNDEFLIRPVARVLVKGKTKSQVIYELCDYKDKVEKSETFSNHYYSEGFHHYHQMKWYDAEQAFSKAYSYMNNSEYTTYIESCKAFQIDPPSPDWTEIRILRNK